MTDEEKEKRRQYYAKNRERIREYDRERHAANPEKQRTASRARYWKNPEQSRRIARERAAADYQTAERKEYLRDYAKTNIDKVREWKRKNRKNSHLKRMEWQRKHRAENPEYWKAKDRKYRANGGNAKKVAYMTMRVKTNLHFKVLQRLSSRIRKVLRENRKRARTLELTGTSTEGLIGHLERQFRYGMTWENHSTKGWHIDHIRPCSSFDLSDPEQQKQCFHYTNLQPLWWWENLAKGDKLVA